MPVVSVVRTHLEKSHGKVLEKGCKSLKKGCSVIVDFQGNILALLSVSLSM
jgi:hypothetical protein